jgi:hypothetical protein
MSYMFDRATSFNGDLSSWDVGQVEQMGGMFSRAVLFNGDLSCWDVGQVVNMNYMFRGATSFDRQLGGEWTSTVNKMNGGPHKMMFCDSPGTIAGRVKDAEGSIE